MQNNYEDIWFLSVQELELMRKESARDYERLNQKFLRLDSILIEKNEKLSRLNREIAVTSRRLKDSKNYVFLVNKKYTDMQDALSLLRSSFGKKERDLLELEEKNQDLQSRLSRLETYIPRLLMDRLDTQIQNKSNTKRLGELLLERDKLSKDVEKFLSETSLERGEFEKKAETLNQTFLESITERSVVSQQLKKAQKKNQEAREVIEKTRVLFVQIDEIKSLKESILRKEKEFGTLEATLGELQAKAHDKNKFLEVLKSRVATEENKISFIADDELIGLGTVMTNFNRLKNDSDIVANKKEEALDKIFELTLDKMGLEENQGILFQGLDQLEKEVS